MRIPRAGRKTMVCEPAEQSLFAQHKIAKETNMSCSHYTPGLAQASSSLSGARCPPGGHSPDVWPIRSRRWRIFARCMKPLQPIENMSGSGREASRTMRQSGNPSAPAQALARGPDVAGALALPARHSGESCPPACALGPQPPNGAATMLMNHRLPDSRPGAHARRRCDRRCRVVAYQARLPRHQTPPAHRRTGGAG